MTEPVIGAMKAADVVRALRELGNREQAEELQEAIHNLPSDASLSALGNGQVYSELLPGNILSML